MTKKDFEFIARGIAANNQDYTLDHLAVQYALGIAKDHPAFDKYKFLKACGCSNITLLAHCK